MESNKHKENDWIEYIQRESWHLELLVSGFSIFLLIQAYDGMSGAFDYLNLHVSLPGNLNGPIRGVIGILTLSSVVLTCNLIIHVFVRGFWVGTVGLRSVQDRIHLDKLGYSDFFTKNLKERVPTLDKSLEKLDTLASTIFSFTFLIVFMILSLFLYMVFMSLMSYGLTMFIQSCFDTEGLIYKILEVTFGVFMMLFLLMGIIYMIDTLSLGFFKKFKRLSKIYYPIYKFVGIVTLAGLYRSIYYSLISRFSKNKIRIALIVYILIIVLTSFFEYDQYIYYPDNGIEFKLNDIVYDDERPDGLNIWAASIPSRLIKDSYLPLFIRYRPMDNEALQMFCTDFVPKKAGGIKSGNLFSSNLDLTSRGIMENNPGNALECLADFYSVTIDSMELKSDYYMYRHPNKEERGIAKMIDIDTLQRGKHIITVKRKWITNGKLVDYEYVSIPFWKE